MACALSSCSAWIATGADQVAATSAQLEGEGQCDQACVQYFRYRQVGSSAWTQTAPVSAGRVNPAVAFSQGIAGLSPDTKYEYQACGQESSWSGAACLGPQHNLAGTVSFFTAPASTDGTLTALWFKSFDGWPYAAKPVVISHTVYVGSWDGYERAYDEAGNLKWATNLGQTGGCQSNAFAIAGVTSAPAFDPSSGLLYLGDGASRFVALDPASGAIKWSIPTDSAPGNYNWSSPVLYKGHAYIGTSSLCDAPLTQGKLLSINLATHRVDAVFAAVPDGDLGGGIWTSPVVDAATNTIFVTTGTRTSAAQTLSESLVALDADSLAVKAHWQAPDDCNPTCQDLDWGTTPSLMTDGKGRQLIAAADKDGFLYAFDRNNLGAGPIWQRQIGAGGQDPQQGQGPVSTGAFDGTYLYYAGGTTTVGGRSYPGSVRAIDPATGNYVWERGLVGIPLAALTVANGEVVVPTYDAGGHASLSLVNAATGSLDYANTGSFYAQATVADGLLFIGDVYGNFDAFPLPSGASQPVSGAALSTPRTSAPSALPRSHTSHRVFLPCHSC